jgi:hypothetical protein
MTTPNHDHATLFVAPPTPAAASTRSPQHTTDDGTEAMERLLHPFTVQPAPATSTETSRA